MRSLATRLIASEPRGNKSADTHGIGAFPASQKLRPHLATLVGDAGFRALLSRSLALAGAEVKWLRAMHVKADGSLESQDQLHAHVEPEEILQGQVALLAELLGLLVDFVGEVLTLRIVGEVWPEIPLGNLESGIGGENEKTK